MSQGTYEETEILLRHYEFVLSSLEKAAFQFRDDGEIMKLLNSADGKKVREFAASYVQAKQSGSQLPTISPVIAPLREKIAMQMIMPIRTIDYTVYWCKLSITQLRSIAVASREFDLRWNLPMTLNACKLYAAFCRIVLYLHRISPVTFLVQLFSSSTLVTTLPLKCNYDDLLNFVTKSQEKPFQFICDELKFIRDKLSLMVVSMLSFFSTLFADWTIIDWSSLSIYERTPEQTIGASMPLTEYTLLANLPLFQEVIILFTLSFSNFMDQNQQFLVLGSAALSESPIFYLSRNFPVPLEELLEVAPKTKAIKNLKITLKETTERKALESHLYRMKQLEILIEEMVNYANLDFTGFIRFIHMIRAVAGFAFYEVDLFFRLKDKNLKTDEHVRTTARLISLLDQLVQLFIDNKTQIERFFVFNLATVDADHLSYLLKNYGTDLGTAGGDVVATGELILESLEDLDLDKFDSGVRFDFYPLQLTHCRALHRHNIISQHLRTSFLTPLCEHLMSISLHASAAQDAVRFFLDACQLHTMWRFVNSFDAFIQHPAAPVDDCTHIFHIFELFNYDSIVLLMHQTEMQSIKNTLENKIRPRISTKIFSNVSNLLNSSSRLMQLSTNGPIGHKVRTEEFNVSLVDNDFCTKEASYILGIAQVNRMIESLPRSVTVLGKTVEIAPYFIRRISTDLMKMILTNVQTNANSFGDSAQFIWTFFSHARSLNIDQFEDTDLLFSRVVYESAMKNSMFCSDKISEQAQAMLGKTPFDPKDVSEPQRLITMIANQVTQFINQGHENFPYCRTSDSFVGDKTMNALHFRALFRIIGVHGALYIDAVLIAAIAGDLQTIVKAFEEAQKNMTENRQNSLKAGVTKATVSALSRISTSLCVRSMVRRALRMVIDETIPGFRASILSSRAEFPDTPEAHLILEIASDDDEYHFISERLAEKVKKQVHGILDFFTFIALLYTEIDFSNVTFDSELDSLSRNIHLLPYAFHLFCQLAPCMFNDANFTMVSAATKLFFSTITDVMNVKKLKGTSLKSYYILIDMFNQFIPNFEYGRMKHAFQYALLTLNYPRDLVN